jgi:hypothetical protein
VPRGLYLCLREFEKLGAGASGGAGGGGRG